MARQVAPAGSIASIARIDRLMAELCDLLGRYVVGTREDRDTLANSVDDHAFELSALVNVLFEQAPEQRERSLDDAQWLDYDDD